MTKPTWEEGEEGSAKEVREIKNLSAILFTIFVYIFLLGFGGKRCQEKIDLCASAGCVNGACVDKLFRYECVCQPGWTGDMCDVGIDDCQDNPCSNGNLFNFKFVIYYNYSYDYKL